MVTEDPGFADVLALILHTQVQMKNKKLSQWQKH